MLQNYICRIHLLVYLLFLQNNYLQKLFLVLIHLNEVVFPIAWQMWSFQKRKVLQLVSLSFFYPSQWYLLFVLISFHVTLQIIISNQKFFLPLSFYLIYLMYILLKHDKYPHIHLVLLVISFLLYMALLHLDFSY